MYIIKALKKQILSTKLLHVILSMQNASLFNHN